MKLYNYKTTTFPKLHSACLQVKRRTGEKAHLLGSMVEGATFKWSKVRERKKCTKNVLTTNDATFP
jgi:hypothetical protein